MKVIVITFVLTISLALATFAQSSAAPQQPTTPPAAGNTTAEDANISHKGKQDDQTSSRPGATSASSTSSNASEQTAQASGSGFPVLAVLSKTVDAKKAKSGDEVTAKTTEDAKGPGALTIPKNSKLIGHVAEVKARDNAQPESHLAIVFDKAALKNGQTVPIQGFIQALAPPIQSAAPAMDMTAPPSPIGGDQSGAGGVSGGAARGASPGSASNPPGGISSNAGSDRVGAPEPQAGVSAPNAPLGAESKGVIGIRGVQLSASPSGSPQGPVLVSNSGNVRLDGGTRLVIRVMQQ